ncbi:Exocyst complex component 4, partial [Globisporangium splendens]
MGRPAHEIWELFTVVVARSREDNKAHPDVKCVFCNTLLANAQPSRNMLRHALQCDELSDDAKVKWKDLARKQRHSIKEKLRTPQKRTPDKGNCSPSRQQKPTKEENYLRVATGFYGTGIPFRCVEDPNFRAMFDYDLPSRHQLASRLLDSIYDREKAHAIEASTEATHLSIVTDGWSNINNESIINFVITKPHIRPVFWKSISTHDAAHTSVFIARSISNAIDEIESVVGKGAVTSVVTDNTANMKGAWKILQHERQGIVCNGCAAHGMSLLMKDVLELEDFATILQQAKIVSRFVKDHHAMWDRFKQLQKQM